MYSLRRILGATALTTALVTALSYALPDNYAATGVGVAFLAATYVLVLRLDESVVREFGLSLGGLLEPTPLSGRRLARDGAKAALWALGLALLVFPFFWFGYVHWWHPGPFIWRWPTSIADEILGQVFVIALPEEAFYRGYVQTGLDQLWSKKLRVLGSDVGWALPITSALFAIGHFLTVPHPNRLAVFFPALLFGWLRLRTGGIGAAVAFHALANLFSASLGRGYGLFGFN